MDSIKTCSALTMVPDEKEIIAANKDIEAVDKDVVKQEYRIIIEGIKIKLCEEMTERLNGLL